MIKVVEEKAYAKINLTLDIKGKRDDGYHELESIMVPIKLHDILYFELLESDEIYIDMPDCDIDLKKNIIYKTCVLMKNKYSINQGIKIKVDKNIPIEAGLAGGSADCAATIRAINRLFELNISQDSMIEIANTLGSDTAFCVFGKPSIVTGRGEYLEEIECNFDHDFYVLKPDFGMSTAEIFKNHKLTESTNAIFKVKEALISNNKELLVSNWFNNLEETVYSISDEMKIVRKALKKISNQSLMSGSGSSIIVFCDNEENMKDFAKEYNCALYHTKIKKS